MLDLLAQLHRKATDFSRLPIILESILAELNHLKNDGAEWCSLVETTVSMLVTEHNITLRASATQTGSAGATAISDYRDSVAIPYIDGLISNIN